MQCAKAVCGCALGAMLLGAVLFGVAGCGNPASPYPEFSETEIPPTEVWIQDYQYTPFHSYVALGKTVTWVNKDSVPHTVTSGSMEDPGRQFDSGLIRPGETFSFTFSDERRAYPYHCAVHGVDPENPPVLIVTDPQQTD